MVRQARRKVAEMLRLRLGGIVAGMMMVVWESSRSSPPWMGLGVVRSWR